MAAVAVVRKRAGGVKTGHAGTLDPQATGVLVLALGKATKIIDQLMQTDKRYHTRIDLSRISTTDDLEGDLTQIAVETPPSQAQIEAALAPFRGTFDQIPPAFSAIKIDGRRAYKLARKGQAPDIPARPVHVHELELLAYDWPCVDLAIHCAKGFYVRSLARDLGAALGTGGCCRSIRRTAVGPFVIDDALALEDVPQPLPQEALISIDDALRMVREASAVQSPD
jgi:tRNA pseudouridine55 synthase